MVDGQSELTSKQKIRAEKAFEEVDRVGKFFTVEDVFLDQRSPIELVNDYLGDGVEKMTSVEVGNSLKILRRTRQLVEVGPKEGDGVQGPGGVPENVKLSLGDGSKYAWIRANEMALAIGLTPKKRDEVLKGSPRTSIDRLMGFIKFDEKEGKKNLFSLKKRLKTFNADENVNDDTARAFMVLWTAASVFDGKRKFKKDVHEDFVGVWEGLDKDVQNVILRTRRVCEVWGVNPDSLITGRVERIDGEKYRVFSGDDELKRVSLKKAILDEVADKEHEVVTGFLVKLREDARSFSKTEQWAGIDTKKWNIFLRDVPEGYTTDEMGVAVTLPEIKSTLDGLSKTERYGKPVFQLQAEARLMTAYGRFLRLVHEKIEPDKLSDGEWSILGSPGEIASWFEFIPHLMEVYEWEEFTGSRDPYGGRPSGGKLSSRKIREEVKNRCEARNGEIEAENKRRKLRGKKELPRIEDYVVDYAFMVHRLLLTGKDVGLTIGKVHNLENRYGLPDVLGHGVRLDVRVDDFSDFADEHGFELDEKEVFEQFLREESRFSMGAQNWLYYALKVFTGDPVTEDRWFRTKTGLAPVYETWSPIKPGESVSEWVVRNEGENEKRLRVLESALRKVMVKSDKGEKIPLPRERIRKIINWQKEGASWTGEVRWRLYFAEKFGVADQSGEFAGSREPFNPKHSRDVNNLKKAIVSEDNEDYLKKAGLDGKSLVASDGWLERLMDGDSRVRVHKYMRNNGLYGGDMSERQLKALEGETGLTEIQKLGVMLRQKKFWGMDFSFSDDGLGMVKEVSSIDVLNKMRLKDDVGASPTLDLTLRYYMMYLYSTYKKILALGGSIPKDTKKISSVKEVHDDMLGVFINVGHSLGLPKPYSPLIQMVNELNHRKWLKGLEGDNWESYLHGALSKEFDDNELWAEYYEAYMVDKEGNPRVVLDLKEYQGEMKKLANRRRLELRRAVDLRVVKWLKGEQQVDIGMITQLDKKYKLFAHVVPGVDGDGNEILVGRDHPLFDRFRIKALGDLFDDLSERVDMEQIQYSAEMSGNHDWGKMRTLADMGLFMGTFRRIHGFENRGMMANAFYEKMGELFGEGVPGNVEEGYEWVDRKRRALAGQLIEMINEDGEIKQRLKMDFMGAEDKQEEERFVRVEEFFDILSGSRAGDTQKALSVLGNWMFAQLGGIDPEKFIDGSMREDSLNEEQKKALKFMRQFESIRQYEVFIVLEGRLPDIQTKDLGGAGRGKDLPSQAEEMLGNLMSGGELTSSEGWYDLPEPIERFAKYFWRMDDPLRVEDQDKKERLQSLVNFASENRKNAEYVMFAVFLADRGFPPTTVQYVKGLLRSRVKQYFDKPEDDEGRVQFLEQYAYVDAVMESRPDLSLPSLEAIMVDTRRRLSWDPNFSEMKSVGVGDFKQVFRGFRGIELEYGVRRHWERQMSEDKQVVEGFVQGDLSVDDVIDLGSDRVRENIKFLNRRRGQDGVQEEWRKYCVLAFGLTENASKDSLWGNVEGEVDKYAELSRGVVDWWVNKLEKSSKNLNPRDMAALTKMKEMNGWLSWMESRRRYIGTEPRAIEMMQDSNFIWVKEEYHLMEKGEIKAGVDQKVGLYERTLKMVPTTGGNKLRESQMIEIVDMLFSADWTKVKEETADMFTVRKPWVTDALAGFLKLAKFDFTNAPWWNTTLSYVNPRAVGGVLGVGLAVSALVEGVGLLMPSVEYGLGVGGASGLSAYFLSIGVIQVINVVENAWRYVYRRRKGKLPLQVIDRLHVAHKGKK